jgi:hypothetical protein
MKRGLIEIFNLHRNRRQTRGSKIIVEELD